MSHLVQRWFTGALCSIPHHKEPQLTIQYTSLEKNENDPLPGTHNIKDLSALIQ